MKIYDQAPEEVRTRVAALLEKFHTDLLAARVVVDLLMVSLDGDEGDAVMLHGHACFAVIRITSTKERAAGRGDAEMLIDGAKYEAMSGAQRDALLDHELYHLNVAKDRFGVFKIDSGDRPQLKMRQHDHEFGWFDAIAKRHGAASFEVQQAEAFRRGSGQLSFGWDVGGRTTAAKSTP